MKTIVIYKSHTGHTKQYADMISENLNCEARDLKNSKNIDLDAYETIIYGGCVRASKIGGINNLFKRLNKTTTQKVFVFAVGANPESDRNTTELKNKNLDDKKLSYPLFYLQGGFDPQKLNFILRKILNGVAKSLKKKQEKDPESLTDEDNDFLEFFQTKHSEVNPDNIKELLNVIISS